MSPLLRRPNVVPSLFSQGGERDDETPRPDRPANRLESLAVALGFSDEDSLIGRGGRALVGSSFAILIGLPVMTATKLVVAVSLTH